MALVIVSPGGVPLVWLVGIVVTLALSVLIAHLCSPKAKRLIGAALVAGGIGLVAPRAHAHADVVMLNPCNRLTPSDLMWWITGCFWP